MSSRRHLGIAIAILLAITGVGGIGLVGPRYREASALNRRVAQLRSSGEDFEAQARFITDLAAELDRAHRSIDADLKVIPPSPDVAGLIQALSPPPAAGVRDQTFTAGVPAEAAPGRDLPVMVQPVTVGLEARFDAVFALLRGAESMDRLLRVSSINITVPQRPEGEPPWAEATIVLEAVYEPPPES